MITNDLGSKGSILYTHVYWDDYFTEEELRKIIDYCESKSLKEALVENDEFVDNRRSKVNFTYPDNENKWIFEKFNNFFNMINEKFYGFDITGYNYFQFTTYSEEEKGHYGWHVDSMFYQPSINGTGLHRKLSMSLLLNDDFEGGDFEINLSEPQKVEMKKGRAIFFPSFVLHRVKEVTKGTRKSLVIWTEGPRWK